eukprot:Phypoly_transcript_11462.p2 GENE.Phypoly_transcript_11462~~Phypoly_transcript_11462.p2  ORF type:complete len:104 (-),score=19.37 Phypoly_transcript_11462:466-777(-)
MVDTPDVVGISNADLHKLSRHDGPLVGSSVQAVDFVGLVHAPHGSVESHGDVGGRSFDLVPLASVPVVDVLQVVDSPDVVVAGSHCDNIELTLVSLPRGRSLL